MKPLAILILALSLGGQLYAATNTNVRVFALESLGEGTTVFSIPQAKAAAQPRWTPESPAQPPLSIYKACSLAKQALANRGKTVAEWRMLDCALREFLDGGYPDRWFYVVGFYRPMSARAARAAERTNDFIESVVVLMDGTVVEPNLKPR